MPSKKTHRKLSKFNIFMKSEIKRCKKSSPNLSHRAAFKMAAQNWKAHSGNSHSSTQPKSRKARKSKRK